MNRPTTTESLPEDRTMRSSRLFSVPQEALWSFFENAAELAKWWGPAGFTNEFHEFDFRTGGAWRFVMRGPDGAEYPMNKVFVRVDKPETIVLDHIDPVHGFRMFMNLHGTSHGTMLEWIMVFDLADEAARVRPFVKPANEQNLDRLDALLNLPPGGGRP
jgi:uncharacterized protein YndB with AHSA1/START domain